MKDWLSRTGQFHIQPNLEGIRRVLVGLGNPEGQCQVILVGGTNGKGVCAHHLANLLQVQGYRVGLYTSPHMNSVRERFKIDGNLISWKELAGTFSSVIETASSAQVELTYFEALTATAYLHFSRLDLDWVVMEVGLGGTWDATNVVSPRAAIITTIAHDHTQYLGRTLAEIASNKADIIHAKTIGVTGVSEIVNGPIRARASKVGTSLMIVDKDFQVNEHRIFYENRIPMGSIFNLRTPVSHYQGLRIPLPGSHQALLAALGIVTIEKLIGNLFDAGLVMEALGRPGPPGRWEVIDREPVVILDGAHNLQAVEALADLLGLADGTIVAVIAQMDDKNIESLVPLIGVVDHLVITSVGGPRTRTPEKIAAFLDGKGVPITIENDVEKALEMGTQLALEMEGMVCVTGSFYLVGKVREILDLRTY